MSIDKELALALWRERMVKLSAVIKELAQDPDVSNDELCARIHAGGDMAVKIIESNAASNDAVELAADAFMATVRGEQPKTNA